MSETLLDVAKLDAFYGRAQILFGMSLTVARGEVVALMGRNGAGKSTTMKALIGLADRSSAHSRFRGHDIGRLDSYRIARLGLGFVPEDRRIFTDLTVEENLEVGRQPPRDGLRPWTPARLYELFPNLGAMRSRRGSEMSGGEQQMLTIARTLMGNPYLVLLDEPSEGVAPLIVEQLAQTIVELKREGLAILLSEQNLPFAAEVSDRAYVMDSGHIRHHASMAELAADTSVQRTYLSM
ncbi:ABC transporter ATP-binding protein [Trinickia fusca]|uniref:ABC transporter ATP-binding protein n=1 Tax=Trinickia fusca TaxID=2419777 RepID=A0A494X817_9BURK|nr:ABC transporter ATP-binding protein [Trinickia fusca]RKP44149.1 ABC transporter ATP-binding protein [Trinickia fusca]